MVNVKLSLTEIQGSGDTASLILKIATRWREVVRVHAPAAVL